MSGCPGSAATHHAVARSRRRSHFSPDTAALRGVYDDLPVNAHYDVLTQVPDDYALVYKRGHYVLSVHCDVHGLKLLHLPLNPDDACKALDSRAYLESLVESVRADPGTFYIWSIEGVHLMRLETDPEYKALPKRDQPPPSLI